MRVTNLTCAICSLNWIAAPPRVSILARRGLRMSGSILCLFGGIAGQLKLGLESPPKTGPYRKTPSGIGDGLSSPELGPFFATSQINANLMGSADCEATIRIVPIAALYPTSTLASALPRAGAVSLPGLWNKSYLPA